MKTDGGLIEVKCNDRERVICTPGYRSKAAGFYILGSGGDFGAGYPDVKCFPESEIVKRAIKDVK